MREPEPTDYLEQAMHEEWRDGYRHGIDAIVKELQKYKCGRTNGIYVEIPLYKLEEIAETMKKLKQGEKHEC